MSQTEELCKIVTQFQERVMYIIWDLDDKLMNLKWNGFQEVLSAYPIGTSGIIL